MGGLCWESREWSETPQCRCRCDDVCGRQSVGLGLATQLLPRELPDKSGQTCWLINTMPTSLRSSVNRSKAASMDCVSVLLSTTRKFFWPSPPVVTCCSTVSHLSCYPAIASVRLTPMPARSNPVTESCQTLAMLPRRVACRRRPAMAGPYLVTNHSQELAILEVCLRCHLDESLRCWLGCCTARCWRAEGYGRAASPRLQAHQLRQTHRAEAAPPKGHFGLNGTLP